MLRRFRLEEPESVRDAADLLARYGESAKVYAGGTELLLAMKEGLIHYEHLVNIKKIRDLDQVKIENGTIRIGALSTHRKLTLSPILKESVTALVKMEESVANIRVREVGTIGGNLCFAEPHADPGTLLLVLGAKLIAEKASSKREVPIEQFFVDAYESCLAQDEVLTEIQVPVPSAHCRIAYLKFGYLERPSVGVALRLDLDEGGRAVKDAHVAVGCAGPIPKRVEEAEGILKDKAYDEASRLIAKAGEIAGKASQAISDLHGSQDYKEHIVGVLLKRAFHAASGQVGRQRGGSHG